MAAIVEIVTGPARAGKTTALIGRLREHLVETERQASHARGVLWIAPTSRAAEEIRDRILGGPVTACLGTSILTFGQFANSIVEASGEEVRSISRVSQRIVLRRLIVDAAAGGQLRHYDGIAETEGFLDLLLDFIRDMKRREIWPEEFDTILDPTNQRTGNWKRDRELADLYRQYQGLLNEHRLFDTEGRFWTARAFLRQGQRRPYASTSLVLVDGFTDFTRTQHEMLTLLTAWVGRLVVSLPLEQTTAVPRSDLFSKSMATLDELKQRHVGAIVTPMFRQKTEWPTLELIEENLFRPPGQTAESGKRVAESGLSEGDIDFGSNRCIRVLRGASDMGEIETIAGEIKHLLTTGAARPGDLLVVARSLEPLAPLVREVFSEFGIPFSMETGLSIGTTSLVRTLLAFLRLDRDDWPFRAVLSMITGWNAGSDNPSAIPAPVAAERVVRRLQIDGGRKRLLDRVRSLVGSRHQGTDDTKANETETHASSDDLAEEIERDLLHQNALVAFPFLERLAALLDGLPNEATPVEWANALASLAREFGYSLEASPNRDAATTDRDSAVAWQRLADCLTGAERLASWLGEASPRLNRTAMMHLLHDIAAYETVPAEWGDTGRVRILSAQSARALRAPHLFMIGVGEGAFPNVHGDDRLFSDSECAAMAAAGLPIETRRQRYEDEMLLFYEVLTRGERYITLSYPGLDERASPLLPSPFLQELLRLGEDRIERIDCLELGPVNRRLPPRSPGEFRVRAVADALEGRTQDDVARLAQLLAHGCQPVTRPESSSVNGSSTLSEGSRQGPPPNVATDSMLGAVSINAGLKIIAERGHADRFGPAEGVMQGKTIVAALTEQFGERHVWSTSQFEAYATCPFRFLMEKILRLERLEDLALETDYLQRGGMVHASLAEFHARLKDCAGSLPPTRAWNAEAFLSQYGKVLDAMIEATPLWGVDAALRELDRRQALDWAVGYFEQHEEYDQQFTTFDRSLIPAHFEVRFGPARHHDEGPEDSLSTDAPFRLDLGDTVVPITGRIDRIDLGKTAGCVVFNIIDYKTGAAKAVTDEEIKGGRRLQGPLYAIAAEQLLLKNQDAIAWQADYWWLRKEGFGKKIGRSKDAPKVFQLHTIENDTIVPTQRWKEVRGLLLDRVRQIISGIRRAEFPMVNADAHCTGSCPFRTVCRVGHVRALEKQWPVEAR